MRGIIVKVYCQSHIINMRLNGSAATSHHIYAASHGFLINLRLYGIHQIYLRKVPWYLIDWRLFLHNSAIYILGGFQNNTLKYVLILYIFWIIVYLVWWCHIRKSAKKLNNSRKNAVVKYAILLNAAMINIIDISDCLD